MLVEVYDRRPFIKFLILNIIYTNSGCVCPYVNQIVRSSLQRVHRIVIQLRGEKIFPLFWSIRLQPEILYTDDTIALCAYPEIAVLLAKSPYGFIIGIV